MAGLDSALITVLSNLGAPATVLILVVLGYLIPKPAHTRVLEDSARKDETIDRLTEALTLERQRSNDATQAGAVTVQLIGALTTLATEHRAAEQHEHAEAAGIADARAAVPPPALTVKDLDL